MFKVEKATSEHLAKMNIRPEFKLGESDKPRLMYQIVSNSCYSVLTESGTVVAIFGSNNINTKVVQLWAVISDEVKRYPIAFHKLVLLLLPEYLNNSTEHRFQMTIREDFKAAAKWAESLGFECEGNLKMYGVDGSNYLLYARVK